MSFRVLDAVAVSVFTWSLIRLAHLVRRRARTTHLKGPPSDSLTFGFPEFLMIPDGPEVYEAWAKQYGSAFQVPSLLGDSRIVLCDPKAIAHFYAKETTTYVITPGAKFMTCALVGRGSLLTSHGNTHKRLRKSLMPAFTVSAIRILLPIFNGSVYKAKIAWDNILENSTNGAIVEVQECLDTIGIAGFSHDFASLDGKESAVTVVFKEIANAKPPPAFAYIYVIAHLFPALLRLPSPWMKLRQMFNDSMGMTSKELLDRTKKDNEEGASEGQQDRSIIGLLIRAGSADAELHMSEEEVLAQMKVLLLAGYETTSIVLTWALIELCRDQEAQTTLREELSQLNGDATWDQLTNGLPYLDAVVYETLRLHPPLAETTRIAIEDDVVPLSDPVFTSSSPHPVTHLSIPRGTIVTVPLASVNRSTSFWGPDAKVFKPTRWIDRDGIPGRAKEVQGHRHILSFSDGPRTCLGKGFAMAELKVVLSVLVRNFTFEFRDGPETKMGNAGGVLPRPKIEGEEGSRVPLRVRRVE
ncbi:cytochrome P450 [Paxillus ammoniavirescens]|nr:cytochrome P450 [Paxillus ammoniavirescens]